MACVLVVGDEARICPRDPDGLVGLPAYLSTTRHESRDPHHRLGDRRWGTLETWRWPRPTRRRSGRGSPQRPWWTSEGCSRPGTLHGTKSTTAMWPWCSFLSLLILG